MMLKKLSIFAVAGLSVFLSGCSLTSISDEQYVQQTVALNQMQQQMTSLLSGMDALREQNQQLSGVLLQMQEYIDQSDKSAPSLGTGHGSADELSGSTTGLDGTGDVTPILDIDVSLPDLTGGTTGGTSATSTTNKDGSGTTISSGTTTVVHKQDTGTLLDELRKASANAKSGAKAQDTAPKVNTGSSGSLVQ